MNTYMHKAGFTIIELMVVLAIIGVLASYAIPAMDGILRKSSVRATQHEVYSSFNYARGEAVSRSKTVTLCPSVAGLACDGSNWSDGWIVFVDVTDNDVVLRAYTPNVKNTIAVKNASDGTALTSISWTFQGYALDEQEVLAVICGRNDEAGYRRGAVVSRTGRVTHTRDVNGDGYHDARFEAVGVNAAVIENNTINCTYGS
ncbi:MAG: type IV fimbrial biogenesis protein FimT [Flavobacteriales bacterium]|jgi:type IV fimbrial biogenesis protein FimT